MFIVSNSLLGDADVIPGLTFHLKFKYAVDEVITDIPDTLLGNSSLAVMCMLLAMRIKGGDAVSRFQYYPPRSGCMAPHVDMITLKDLNRYVITFFEPALFEEGVAGVSVS